MFRKGISSGTHAVAKFVPFGLGRFRTRHRRTLGRVYRKTTTPVIWIMDLYGSFDQLRLIRQRCRLLWILLNRIRLIMWCIFLRPPLRWIHRLSLRISSQRHAICCRSICCALRGVRLSRSRGGLLVPSSGTVKSTSSSTDMTSPWIPSERAASACCWLTLRMAIYISFCAFWRWWRRRVKDPALGCHNWVVVSHPFPNCRVLWFDHHSNYIFIGPAARDENLNPGSTAF
jgi:hypothetical protein